jgi:hypothetical protein
MICAECSKLAIKTGNKKCKNCKLDIYDNLSLICSKCSAKDLACSICLKKVYLNNNIKKPTLGSRGCGSCGSKKQ